VIFATATSSGLTIQCGYDPNWYTTGIRISDTEVAAVPLDPRKLPRQIELHDHLATNPT